MPNYAEFWAKDHKVVPLHLGGSSGIQGDARGLSEVHRLANKVSVLIDSEGTRADEELEARRLNFVEACKKLGFDVHVTRLRAIENYLTDAAVRAVLGPGYGALGPYDLLRDSANPWSKRDTWRVAVEMTREDLQAMDLHDFFERL